MREIYGNLRVFWAWPTIFLAGIYFGPELISYRYHQTDKPKKFFLPEYGHAKKAGYVNFGRFLEFWPFLAVFLQFLTPVLHYKVWVQCILTESCEINTFYPYRRHLWSSKYKNYAKIAHFWWISDPPPSKYEQYPGRFPRTFKNLQPKHLTKFLKKTCVYSVF